MNRRNFIGLAVAAALAPVAFARKPSALYEVVDVKPFGPVIMPSQYSWRQYHLGFEIDESAAASIDQLNALWADYMDGAMPDLIVVDPEVARLVKKHRPELFHA